MQFITTIPMFTTKIENKAWHCPIERRGPRFYHNSSPPPSVNVGGSGTGFWQHDSNQHWVGGEGSLFLLNQTKCVNNIFHDCRLGEFLKYRHSRCKCGKKRYLWLFKLIWVCWIQKWRIPKMIFMSWPSNLHKNKLAAKIIILGLIVSKMPNIS